jgi:secreted PhoX family phosphatase
MINRRRFIKSIAAAAAPVISQGCAAAVERTTKLRSDKLQVMDLPPGFSYRVISRAGDRMSDGLTVPGMHDGMAAFSDADGNTRLVCNHEIRPEWTDANPLRDVFASLPETVKARFYDRGGDVTPGLGGTTTTILNASGETERQFLSLGGTEINCAGGPTPWGSWLSCEECFRYPGTRRQGKTAATREKRHGYVFEVPAEANEIVEAIPIKAMGQFEHEAAAVHPQSGVVYMTEDKHHSLFYRFVPAVPGKLIEGGNLQALAVIDRPSQRTHNWMRQADIRVGESLAVRWIDLSNVEEPWENVTRLNGATAGAATFARGEGLTHAGDRFAFTCTNGGIARLGQVFTYTPSPYEGTPQETESPGQLQLIAEADGNSLLQNADNLTMAPWGDLIVCEDTSGNCGIVGIRPDGSQYPIADNTYSDSELAGVCFSPDGETMFVNVQYPGMTLAITGPWSDLSAD